jgi:hypothetical protein
MGRTVSEIVVVAVSEPEVPVIVTVEFPAAAELLTVSVSTLEVVEDAGLNEAVTPLGSPDAANVKLPLNGLTSVTVIVSVPLAEFAIDSEVAEDESKKLPVPTLAVTVRVMVVEAVRLPEVPVMVIG